MYAVELWMGVASSANGEIYLRLLLNGCLEREMELSSMFLQVLLSSCGLKSIPKWLVSIKRLRHCPVPSLLIQQITDL